MKMKRFFSVLCALVTVWMLVCSALPAEALNDDDKVIVAFGDSITASGKWFSVAEKEFGIKVVNKGVGGENSKDGRARLNGVLAYKPDIVVLSFGMNDAAYDMAKYVPLENYKENMAYMVDKMQEKGIKVILLIVNPIGEEPYYTRHDKSKFVEFGGANAFFFRYVEAARALGREKKLTVIDMYQPLYDTGKWNDYLADGVHPNNNGYAMFAEAFKEALYRVDLGDVNGDGRIGPVDYMLVKSDVLGSKKLTDRKRYGDVNGDGNIGPVDYMLIKSHVIGSAEINRY